MTIVQETTEVVGKPRHRATKVRSWWKTKTDGNFTFGAMVGLIFYMLLSVAWRLAVAIF